MNKRSSWSVGLSGVCGVAVAAAFAVALAGCTKQSDSVQLQKQSAGCQGKCAGKCTTPCKNADGTVKCAADCKKPCCAKKNANVTKTSGTPAAQANQPRGGHQKAARKKASGCSPGCKKPCGGRKVAKCSPDCKKPCCAKKSATPS